MQKPKVIIIGGPTASGKSSLAIELAKVLNGEIISADSMQIYKKLDIGTAKVTEEEMQGIKHYMIDICEVEEKFSVADFQKLAYEYIEKILAKGKTPIIAGGTGLYISSLVDNMKFTEETKKDKIVREKLYQKAEELKEDAPDYFYDMLLKIDEEAAKKIEKNNLKRVIRALEIYYTTGETKTMQDKKTTLEDIKYDYKTFIIDWDRQMLYDRINKRIDIMINQDILKEVKWLYNKKLPQDNTAMAAIGYKEFFPYLNGQLSLEECVEKLKQETRRYAKRQITWFKRIKNIKYIDYKLNTKEKINYILKNI